MVSYCPNPGGNFCRPILQRESRVAKIIFRYQYFHLAPLKTGITSQPLRERQNRYIHHLECSFTPQIREETSQDRFSEEKVELQKVYFFGQVKIQIKIRYALENLRFSSHAGQANIIYIWKGSSNGDWNKHKMMQATLHLRTCFFLKKSTFSFR